MKNYGLTGNPLGHSMSRIIHNKILELKGIEGDYKLYPTDNLKKSYEDTLSKLCGFNVTIPYKKDIMKLIDTYTDEVKLYDSCNTVIIKDGRAYGHNTDVYGINDTFKKNGITLENKNVLVTGAGGVSSLMACEAALQGANVYISCRNKEKAGILIRDIFDKTGKTVKFMPKDKIQNIDILMQGTPLGMYPNPLGAYIPLNKLKNIPVVFDTVYNPYKTLTLRVSEYYKNKALGGLNMLVGQAVKAQELFNNITLTKDEFDEVVSYTEGFIPEFKIEKNIILIGAPGSGKTTISREIAKLLNMKFTDIDREIVEKEGRSINDIFASEGQDYFRQVEREVFFDKVNSTGNVIATGGGLPEFNDLSKLDKDKNIIVFLDVKKSVLYKRLANDTSRPLLKGNKTGSLDELIKRRYPLYSKYADVKINVEKERYVKDIVVEIIDILKN